MDQATLDKLRSNPHYKLSAKQREEAAKLERPMVEFGTPPIHNDTPQKTTGLGRKKRS